MQARITKISFDEETGLTEAVLSTPYGTFVGYAQYNKDEEKFKPSVFVGDNLAEARAYIAAYNEALQRKREQRKGIKRLMYSCGGSKEAYKYANKDVLLCQNSLYLLQTYLVGWHICVEKMRIICVFYVFDLEIM